MKQTPPPGKSAAANDMQQAEIDVRNANTLRNLQSYMKAHGISRSSSDLAKLGRSMKSSGTYLYRYLENKFKASAAALAALESKIENFITSTMSQEAKFVSPAALVSRDFIVDGVARFLGHVRKHAFIGIGYGEAGAGKSKACEVYALQNSSTTIYLHLTVWRGGRHALVKQIKEALSITRVPKGEVIDDVLVERLRGSNVLICIDNGHRLTESARAWLADFWEETKSPIAIIGNPEIAGQWERNDQHGSRVGIFRDVTLDLAKHRDSTADHLLSQFLPAGLAVPSIRTDAAAALEQFGRCRRVEKRATLTTEILNSKDNQVNDPVIAWKMAETQLISPQEQLKAKRGLPSQPKLTAGRAA